MHNNLMQFFNSSELKNYLKTPQFSDRFMPYKTLPFLMHWSDHKSTTTALKKEITHNERPRLVYQELVQDLESLKRIPLWLEVEGRVHQFNLYDVYSHLFVTKKFSHEQSYPVSFIGPYGPFVHKKLFECLNFNTYKNFIYNFLIEGKIPQRSFRLQCEQQIIIGHKKSSKDHFNNAIIRSLSEDGMLVEVDAGANIEDLKNAQNIAFHISTKELNNSFEDAKKIITHSKFLYSKDPKSCFEFNTTDLVFRTSVGTKKELSYFIFAKYENSKNDYLWPDLKKIANTAKNQVEEIIDLAA